MIKENLKSIKADLGKAKLIVVSKFRELNELEEVYREGERDFAENRVQELLIKVEKLPEDIRWHMIGHLQSKKVKQIASFIHLIHSVDSVKLLVEINKQAQKHDRVIPVLLQIHIAEEEQKHGLTPGELMELIEDNSFLQTMTHIEFRGLMGMATFTDNELKIENEFSQLHELLNRVQKSQPNWKSFRELSMGMSNDCHIAVRCGSTMVRIGSNIFH
jgi:pyridoxal phosphate enzyme (YggS family)